MLPQGEIGIRPASQPTTTEDGVTLIIFLYDATLVDRHWDREGGRERERSFPLYSSAITRRKVEDGYLHLGLAADRRGEEEDSGPAVYLYWDS